MTFYAKRKKNFRVLFEDTKARGFIGWTLIEDCDDMNDAISYFSHKFSNKEIIQVREVA